MSGEQISGEAVLLRPLGHVASRRVMEKAGMLLSDERLGDLDGEMVGIAIYEA